MAAKLAIAARRWLLGAAICLIAGVRAFAGGGEWTWIKGSSLSNQPGVYGIRGIPDPANTPGARESACTWIDNAGNLWLFGGVVPTQNGSTFLNDLWKFDIGAESWTWMKGSDTGNQTGIYGVQGVGDPANTPGARASAITWTDAAGNLWLYGGSDPGYYLCDLWEYIPSTGNWIWVNGRKYYSSHGIYGVQGAPDSANTPGSRLGSVAWTDDSGGLWLFGGWGLFPTGQSIISYDSALGNDLWRFDIETGFWTWMKGSFLPFEPGVYGVKGVSASTNTPGARSGAVGWKDRSGTFWLFGGNGGSGYCNDIWKYDPSTGNWVWMNGANIPNQESTYGVQGVESASNTPSARSSSANCGGMARNGGSSDFWLFGGLHYPGELYCNDLWRLNPATSNWTWMKGTSSPTYAGKNGVYGIKGTPDPTNIPGTRYGASAWMDVLGELWIFGGGGRATSNANGAWNDLWRWTPEIPDAAQDWTMFP